MTTTNNNNVHNNGVERVNTIMDNQQKKSFPIDDLLSGLNRFEKEIIKYAFDDLQNQNKTKQTIDHETWHYAYTKLHEMAQMQNDLDTFIIKSRNLKINNTELTAKLEIALHVELFELVNECRSIFKYWSSKPENESMILEEYADGIHFILSLGNHTGLRHETIDGFLNGLFSDLPPFSGIQTITKYIVLIESLPGKAYLYGVLARFLGLDMPTIYEAYRSKNDKNITRQKDGY